MAFVPMTKYASTDSFSQSDDQTNFPVQRLSLVMIRFPRFYYSVHPFIRIVLCDSDNITQANFPTKLGSEFFGIMVNDNT